jgi:hypothetical protein
MTTPDKRKPVISHFHVSTQHYNFMLTVKTHQYPYRIFHLIVGDQSYPCLESTITLENNTSNDRYTTHEFTATLNNIKALKTCALDDISDDYLAKYSFGTELLDFVSFFINSQFPKVNTVKLHDDSVLWCNYDTNDRLDLLAYSIALHGKTWYENKINAYMKPKERYDIYRKEVELYCSKETKQKTKFMDVYGLIIENCKLFIDMVCQSIDIYEKLFNESETLPDFFRNLNKTIPREDKSKFYRGWLPEFIYSHIKTIDRTWYFDLYPKILPIEELPRKLNKTRRRKHITRQTT